MRTANRYGNSEELEQRRLIAIVGFFERQHPELRWLFHIPNGGWRHAATAKNLKRMGVRPGVPDLFLPVPRQGHGGLWIEMKSRNGRTTKLQDEWLHALAEYGYATRVCFSALDALMAIWQYMGYDAEELERSVKNYDSQIERR